MIYSLNSVGNSFISMCVWFQSTTPPSPFLLHSRHARRSQRQNHKYVVDKARRRKTHIMDPATTVPKETFPSKSMKKRGSEEKIGSLQLGNQKMVALCGYGYWVQGFRCFPWLALNFHMAQNLHLHPSTLQIVQNTGNLPMVAKPLYGILSDAVYIGGAHRIPYICIGALLQLLSWSSLALIPAAGESLPTLMACVLLSNLGASITEVAKDGLVTEYGQSQGVTGLQSYAFMASAAGGILGNLLGGFLLLKAPPCTVFLLFAASLTIQLATSLSTREDSLDLLPPPNDNVVQNSVFQSLRTQFSDLKAEISEEDISGPVVWIVASIAVVPILSGSIFCYQTQYLHLDSSIIGMSRVISQLMILSMSVLYDRFLKNLPMIQIIGFLQILYALSLLFDFVLVKQINLNLGISNEVFVLCFSGVAEAIAHFKMLPFQVLLASLAPAGCEGSLMSFLASALCLSSIFSGFLGVELAGVLGITTAAAGGYSSLPLGIVIEFLAALVPLGWIYLVPMSRSAIKKEGKNGASKMAWKPRKEGRGVYSLVNVNKPKKE